MQPQPCQQDREHLYFCYFMDCQTPQKPGGGKDQTWEVAERAVHGLAEVFAERDLIHALGFCSEPEVARRQSALFREMADLGAWQALHFQVRGYRPAGATEDFDWERPLTDYDYEEQKAVIATAKDEWEQALGMPVEDFGACCAQANDYTFPILAELGFRQSYCSAPGRYNPAAGQMWWGAFPHSHHASSKSRLVCGELPLYEFTLTRTLVPQEVSPGVWMVDDLRAERERVFDDAMAIAEASVRDMMRRDHPILYVHVPTHNTWDVTDIAHPRREAVETAIDVARALAEMLDLELVPATLRDMHERADELGAY
ncbi:MAG: hypothetical protein U9R79_02280 [Armatimonadota bacterium]|nr:hypothetical protein [Armatimonadota bacterium]